MVAASAWPEMPSTLINWNPRSSNRSTSSEAPPPTSSTEAVARPGSPDHFQRRRRLFQTASVLVMTVGLAGSQITSRLEFGTVPVATTFLGPAVTTFPAAWMMARFGRRLGFVLGALLGVLGGVGAALGVWLALCRS